VLGLPITLVALPLEAKSAFAHYAGGKVFGKIVIRH
jgi:hypothetical protein